MEITLSYGNQRAVVAALGASLRKYFLQEPDGKLREVIWGYAGAIENKKGGQGDVLVPFPSRIPDGRYRFEGHDHELDCNDKEGHSAIHGFLRTQNWQAETRGSGEARFTRLIKSSEFKGYPFDLACEVVYRLGEGGLECEFKLQNVGAAPAPAAIGFHPYFRPNAASVDGAELELPCSEYLEFGPGFVPTGKWIDVAVGDAASAAGEVDFRTSRKIGATKFNHCFGGVKFGGTMSLAFGSKIRRAGAVWKFGWIARFLTSCSTRAKRSERLMRAHRSRSNR